MGNGTAELVQRNVQMFGRQRTFAALYTKVASTANEQDKQLLIEMFSFSGGLFFFFPFLFSL